MPPRNPRPLVTDYGRKVRAIASDFVYDGTDDQYYYFPTDPGGGIPPRDDLKDHALHRLTVPEVLSCLRKELK